ncbi:MAG TPA: PIG-L deacetylase family protein [Steroidobacteraceae bacterium]|jgi:LmbE family N-acetylglucosaminyl deacetylase
MLTFRPDLPATPVVLCLGAHCDDIEIGCAGALMELQSRYPSTRFIWQVFSGEDGRDAETRAAAARLLGQDCEVTIQQFRASYMPHSAPQIKAYFDQLKASGPRPDVIFTHFLHDRHQDHRLIAELTWNTFRDHAVLEYEIPKFEGDLAHPNVFVPLTAPVVDRKVSVLMECFPSQHSRQWFDPDLFRGHLRLRGVECNSPSRFAEAFHVRKLVL